MAFHVPESRRITDTTHPNNLTFKKLATPANCGNYGIFFARFGSREVFMIASNGGGWEHVSVSIGGRYADRCPTWDEMCRIKSWFWDEEDTVVQFHPPKSEYVNNHPFVLHLWRKENEDFPIPPKEFV